MHPALCANWAPNSASLTNGFANWSRKPWPGCVTRLTLCPCANCWTRTPPLTIARPWLSTPPCFEHEGGSDEPAAETDRGAEAGRQQGSSRSLCPLQPIVPFAAAQNDPSNRPPGLTTFTSGPSTTTSANPPHYSHYSCPFSSLTRCESPSPYKTVSLELCYASPWQGLDLPPGRGWGVSAPWRGSDRCPSGKALSSSCAVYV